MKNSLLSTNVLLLLTISLALSLNLRAQKDSMRIEFIEENIVPEIPALIYFTKVKFSNAEDTIYFDVLNSNPYNELDLPVLSKEERIYNYDIEVNQYDIHVARESPVLRKYMIDIDEEKQSRVKSNGGGGSHSSLERNSHQSFIVISYSFYLINHEEEIFSTPVYSSFLILNNKGEIQHKLMDHAGGANDLLITPDGKYFAYTFNEAGKDWDAGFRLFDLTTGNLIFEKTNLNVAGAHLNSSSIMTFATTTTTIGKKVYYFLSIKENKLYSYEVNLFFSTNDILENGIYIWNQQKGEKELILFSSMISTKIL